MARLFVGISIHPTPALSSVSLELARLSPLLGVTPDDRLHLTLRFIGDREPSEIGAIGGAVERAAQAIGWFNLSLRGLGRFPPTPKRMPRIVYAGVADPHTAELLSAAITRELAELPSPIPPDPKPWQAHVTLARHRPRKSPTPTQRRRLERLLAEHTDTPFGATPVRHIELVQSTLTRQSPVYETLRRPALATAPTG